MRQNKWTALTAFVTTFLASQAAMADFSLAPAPLIVRAHYDYAPSVIDDGQVIRFWWCGYNDGAYSDAIYHRSYTWASGTWSTIRKVLEPTAGRWDGTFVCDPSIVRGSFYNPQNGLTYTYAMYYTGTTSIYGLNGRIGVAYSNNGLDWIKRTSPVIYPQGNASQVYGAGQPSVYNSTGGASLWLFHYDNSTANGGRFWARSTQNGYTFSAPILLSNAGAPLDSNADFAYDYNTNTFYAAIPLPWRWVGERESLGFVFARMSASDLLAGTGTWEQLGTVNTNLTGYYLNHSPGLLRDMYGNLTAWLPAVEAFFAVGTNSEPTWELTWAIWDPTPNTLAFNEYWSEWSGEVKATTGKSGDGYVFSRSLGYLFMAPQTGTIPLYGCQVGSDYFVSHDSGCEGQFPLGVNGWLYDSWHPSTMSLYRCFNGYDHWVSNSSTCEGATMEGWLGYAKSSP